MKIVRMGKPVTAIFSNIEGLLKNSLHEKHFFLKIEPFEGKLFF